MGKECPKCHFDNPDDSKFCKECGTKLISSEEIPVSPTKTLETPAEELTLGSTLAGRYQLIEKIGKGGMDKVYWGKDTKLGREVALKLIPEKFGHDWERVARFEYIENLN